MLTKAELQRLRSLREKKSREELGLFVVEGENRKNPISSMPGHFQLSLDHLADEAREIRALGIPAVILFGIPTHKDACGSQAMSGNSIVCRAVQALKKATPELYVIADVCCCEYTHALIADEDSGP